MHNVERSVYPSELWVGDRLTRHGKAEVVKIEPTAAGGVRVYLAAKPAPLLFGPLQALDIEEED